MNHYKLAIGSTIAGRYRCGVGLPTRARPSQMQQRQPPCWAVRWPGSGLAVPMRRGVAGPGGDEHGCLVRLQDPGRGARVAWSSTVAARPGPCSVADDLADG